MESHSCHVPLARRGRASRRRRAASAALGAALFAVSYGVAPGADSAAPPIADPTSAPAPPPAVPSPAAPAADAPASDAYRLREGTQLTDRLGHFRQQGEAVIFIDDQGRQLGGLPNLNLERIVRMLKGVDEPESVAWSVSGAVTEFGGRNYLLITRAVYKSATLPPAPDLVE